MILKILGAPKLEIETNQKTASRNYILDHTAHAIMLALRLSEESRSKACVFFLFSLESVTFLFDTNGFQIFQGGKRGRNHGMDFQFVGAQGPMPGIQWLLFLVPLKGGCRWHSPSTNWQEKYHLYTLPNLGGYMLPIPPFRGTRNNH